jgi:hypothetical protein
MPKSIHFICKGRKHIVRLKGTTYVSGYWNIDADTARQLVGGMVYFHETKNSPSYFGGQVTSWRFAETEDHPDHIGDIILTFEATMDGKNAKWSGRDHTMAWTRGLID